MTFGQNLKQIREEKGITQAELAAKIGVTQQSVAKYEKLVYPPSESTFKKIARGLDIHPNKLLSPFRFGSPNQFKPADVHDSEEEYINNDTGFSDEFTFNSIQSSSQRISNSGLSELKIIAPKETINDYKHLIDIFQSLNTTGKQKVLSYIEDIGKIYSGI